MSLTIKRILEYEKSLEGPAKLTAGNSLVITINGVTSASYTVPSGKECSININARGVEA